METQDHRLFREKPETSMDSHRLINPQTTPGNTCDFIWFALSLVSIGYFKNESGMEWNLIEAHVHKILRRTTETSMGFHWPLIEDCSEKYAKLQWNFIGS